MRFSLLLVSAVVAQAALSCGGKNSGAPADALAEAPTDGGNEVIDAHAGDAVDAHADDVVDAVDASTDAASADAATSNDGGAVCVDPQAGPDQAPATLPACSLPAASCTGTSAYCAELVRFVPTTTAAYDDFPYGGETPSNQYRSFVRRDLAMAIQYATAKVACLAASWPCGNGGPIGLGDMSEADGSIPGTSVGDPGHPQGTHTGGRDIDVAYYQIGTADNRLRPVCPHTQGTTEAYRCTAEPDTLDVWRTALLIGILHEQSKLRIIGVDGQIGEQVRAALTTLCTRGWLSGTSCTAPRLAYELTDTGAGWFYFHHANMHVSITP